MFGRLYIPCKYFEAAQIWNKPQKSNLDLSIFNLAI